MPSNSEHQTDSSDHKGNMMATELHQHTSHGIILPDERSSKQRNYAFCENHECREINKSTGQMDRFHFEVEHSIFCCPKCGANKPPIVGMLAKVHLMVRDKLGEFEGAGGLRYRIACDKGRGHISTLTNHEAGTDDLSVVTCEDCLEEARRLNAPAQSGLKTFAY